MKWRDIMTKISTGFQDPRAVAQAFADASRKKYESLQEQVIWLHGGEVSSNPGGSWIILGSTILSAQAVRDALTNPDLQPGDLLSITGLDVSGKAQTYVRTPVELTNSIGALCDTTFIMWKAYQNLADGRSDKGFVNFTNLTSRIKDSSVGQLADNLCTILGKAASDPLSVLYSLQQAFGYQEALDDTVGTLVEIDRGSYTGTNPLLGWLGTIPGLDFSSLGNAVVSAHAYMAKLLFKAVVTAYSFSARMWGKVGKWLKDTFVDPQDVYSDSSTFGYFDVQLPFIDQVGGHSALTREEIGAGLSINLGNVVYDVGWSEEHDRCVVKRYVRPMDYVTFKQAVQRSGVTKFSADWGIEENVANLEKFISLLQQTDFSVPKEADEHTVYNGLVTSLFVSHQLLLFLREVTVFAANDPGDPAPDWDADVSSEGPTFRRLVGVLQYLDALVDAGSSVPLFPIGNYGEEVPMHRGYGALKTVTSLNSLTNTDFMNLLCYEPLLWRSCTGWTGHPLLETSWDGEPSVEKYGALTEPIDLTNRQYAGSLMLLDLLDFYFDRQEDMVNTPFHLAYSRGKLLSDDDVTSHVRTDSDNASRAGQGILSLAVVAVVVGLAIVGVKATPRILSMRSLSQLQVYQSMHAYYSNPSLDNLKNFQKAKFKAALLGQSIGSIVSRNDGFSLNFGDLDVSGLIC